MKKRFIFVRHGHTDWDISMLSKGPLDLGLNDVGRKSIKTLASKLFDSHFCDKSNISDAATLSSNKKKIKKSLIISSDLKRAVETSKIIEKTLNCSAIYTDLLRERYYGDFSNGKLGHDMENKYDFDLRVKEAVRFINKSAVDLKLDFTKDMLIVVSHAQVFKSTLQYCDALASTTHLELAGSADLVVKQSCDF